jgi:multidrug efflux pump subunit AcrB
MHRKRRSSRSASFRSGKIRDVGRDVEAPTDVTIASYENEKRDILLVVYKQPGANIIDTVEKIRARLTPVKTKVAKNTASVMA